MQVGSSRSALLVAIPALVAAGSPGLAQNSDSCIFCSWLSKDVVIAVGWHDFSAHPAALALQRGSSRAFSHEI